MVPASVTSHPMVFVTLTAPSFVAVHRETKAGEQCRRPDAAPTCPHGVPTGCGHSHNPDDSLVGQARCNECYRYLEQVVFTWHAPELWSRFTLTLRRKLRRRLSELGHHPDSTRVSFVKIVEMQRRGVPHFHAIIRLDGRSACDQADVWIRPAIEASELEEVVSEAILAKHVDVLAEGREVIRLRFGAQYDIQPLSQDPGVVGQLSDGAVVARRVEGYLAKYVTKSVVDFGLSPGRIVPSAIDHLDAAEHVKRLLRSVVQLSAEPGHEQMIESLHTLGYRGHVTTKSRRYSTTMFALRTKRSRYLQSHFRESGIEFVPNPEDTVWEYAAYGHASAGEHLLAISAAVREKDARWAARQLVDSGGES